MNLSRRATTAAALTVLALGGTVAATAPASAATTTKAAAASYNGACGTGYKVIDSTPVGNSGKVFLTWNESTGKNCAVTIRNTTGAKTHMEVTLKAIDSGERTAVDSGQYTSYAGPVYVNARGYCVAWGGTIGTASAGDSGHCS
ncbi:spore-associated protein A [Streptomyces guryensis]|uniref:Spore-associated protein A n=1 Tax=Streptomyces guryensis TaxID=2886947 RepID=A0A9Q3ZB54_9ACTN|nr:spore-associated protein A [Streptomyces guryensis]MCD9876015.1 spore-associated protein A [Streptomyces guryensis]